MQPWHILTVFVIYFTLLIGIAWWTSRNANEESYFIGNRNSIWWLVAFGMLSDSMSGVSFISVPGNVHRENMYYLQLVGGYLVGYILVAKVLLPLYYKLQLTSIYTYLGKSVGYTAHHTGAVFFVISRLLGSAARLYLTAIILQEYLFSKWNWPFWMTVLVIIVLILGYTIKGGIKTLVFTDALQSLILVGGVLVCVVAIASGIAENHPFETLSNSKLGTVFNWDIDSKYYFWKHFLGGIFITITMTGMDQNMMQKNLSCRSLKEAQWNMISYGFVVVLVNIVFVSMGVWMYAYAQEQGISLPTSASGLRTDGVFPLLALNHLGTFVAVAFIAGLAAATFSSADSVLTTLTTSTYIDLIRVEEKKHLNASQKHQIRIRLHMLFAVLLLITILIFHSIHSGSLIDLILLIAAFTYGPILGLFAMGIFTKRTVGGWIVPIVCVLVPLLMYAVKMNEKKLFGSFVLGNEILLYNGALVFLFLWMGSWIFPEKNKVPV